MNLYIIWQDENNMHGAYQKAVVCAKDETDAKSIHPNNTGVLVENKGDYPNWVIFDKVKVEYLGKAKKGFKRGVIVSDNLNS